ncbi:MAG: FAD-binding oxidoreductase [Proteobacteria bacterium]|nr:FAD-binding oxidoreductase [Pseudomonadota bacterium]
MSNDKAFVPEWIETVPQQGTYRSIFKWGAPDEIRHPSNGFFKVIREYLGLSDADFLKKVKTGDGKVKNDMPSKLSNDDIAGLCDIVGKDNLSLDEYDRLKYSTGKSMEDILKLRDEMAENLSDCVVHPRDKEDVKNIVSFCNGKHIPVQVYSGGSSVTLGLDSLRGGVTLVMGTYMNRVLEFNEDNQTITVEPGMMGPTYENLLNNAPKKLGAKACYTGGHFPQSFEYSSVGGWVVTLGSGQASSYYGDAYDLVISQEYVAPSGSFKTLNYPGTATGPKINDIMKGSEGCFGVLVGLTMKVFKYLPENTQQFAFMFPDWELAVKASRDISQGEFGMPSILRISDAEETDIGLKMKMDSIAGPYLDRLMRLKGMKTGKRCLLIGQADGESGFTKNIKINVKRICKSHKGMYLTRYPMAKWRHGRFSDAYLREDLNDFGVVIDTLESSVTWDNILNLHQRVRSFIKSHPNTICMTHASHFYSQGTNLYFIFITPLNRLKDFREFQRGIINEIIEHGGSLSHHHGVGRMMGPWMEQHLGKEQVDVLRALKRHFDPNNIMNPGGTLGLDA